MVEFRPVEEDDLPAIREIYDHYILNSTATFHSRPIPVPELKEILGLSLRKYPAFTIRANGRISAGKSCAVLIMHLHPPPVRSL